MNKPKHQPSSNSDQKTENNVDQTKSANKPLVDSSDVVNPAEDLVYKGGYSKDPQEIVQHPAVAPQTLDDARSSAQNTMDTTEGIPARMAHELKQQATEATPEPRPSEGTGVQARPTDRAGKREDHPSLNAPLNAATPELTGGDIDANYEQANAVGDEAVGGTAPTPDQNVVDDLGTAVGLEVDDRSFLRTQDMLEERDEQRWELNPKSSEDYENHQP